MATDQLMVYRGAKKAKKERGRTAKERISKMPPCAAGKRSSIYRGVTRHRWTGRYEAHLWDKSTWNQNQNKKGNQVYLGKSGVQFVVDYSRKWQFLVQAIAFTGAYDDEEAAARAYCIERKIDLTSYIKWWGPNRSHQGETGMKSSEETKNGCVGDIGVELKTLEWGIQPTEPYQMPRLGISHVSKKHKGTRVSAMSILSWSAAYNNLQEKASQMEENNVDNDENENKYTIHKVDYGKAVEKSTSHDERLSSVLGMSGGMSLQTDVFLLAPFLSAPLLTNYNAFLWTSLAPVLPSVISCTTEITKMQITKMETSSTFTLFHPEE